MPRPLVLLGLSALLAASGCKRSTPPAPDAGGVARAMPAPEATTDGAARDAVDAAPRPAVPDSFEVVAVGSSYGSKILWVQALGTRVWLSARNLDAFAEGDGPLAKGPDILAKLPYEPGVHRMDVVGRYPHLYALRTKKVEGRADSPEPTLFVYQAEQEGPGTWRRAKPLERDWAPYAFVAYREGALLMWSSIEMNSAPFLTRGETGTSLVYLAPDGSVSDPKLDVPRDFLAWSAASDGESLTLLGTTVVPAKTKGEDPEPRGLHVVRITKQGARRTQVQTTTDDTPWLEAYFTGVRERGGVALVMPPSRTLAPWWTPSPLALVLVGADGKRQPRVVAGDESCSVVTAQHVGDVIYAIRRCLGDGSEEVVRVGPDGRTERIALPRLAKEDGGGFRVARPTDKGAIGCTPAEIVVREPDDVWVSGRCGAPPEGSSDGPSVPILLRRGRAQPPVVLP